MSNLKDKIYSSSQHQTNKQNKGYDIHSLCTVGHTCWLDLCSQNYLSLASLMSRFGLAFPSATSMTSFCTCCWKLRSGEPWSSCENKWKKCVLEMYGS